MDAQQAFENYEKELRRELSTAATVDAARGSIRLILERISADCIESEEGQDARDRRRAAMALVRQSQGLLSACTSSAEVVMENEKPDDMARFLRLAGLACLLIPVVTEAVGGRFVAALLTVAGAAVMLAGGREKAPGVQARSRVMVDPEIGCREVLQLCKAADVLCSDLQLIERESGLRQSEETGDALLSLLSTLLESGDEDSRTLAGQAMKELGMQAVPYSTDAQEAFDVLPTRGETRTVRPAIAREGKVLRRGLAVMHGQS